MPRLGRGSDGNKCLPPNKGFPCPGRNLSAASSISLCRSKRDQYSLILFARLVSHRCLRCGVNAITAAQRSIHSSGTHGPNKSVMSAQNRTAGLRRRRTCCRTPSSKNNSPLSRFSARNSRPVRYGPVCILEA